MATVKSQIKDAIKPKINEAPLLQYIYIMLH